VKTYIKENEIIYLLEIPLVTKDIYNYYRLYPLPVISHNHTFVILPKFPYLIAKGLNTRLLAHPCQEADESFYLCPEDDTTQLIKDACITDLMMYAENMSSCLSVPIDLEAVRVQLIQQNTWILYTKEPTLLTKLCTDEVSRQKIYGTYIITLDDNCSARIKGINLTRQPVETESSTYLKLPLINLPTINLPAEAPPLKSMNLKGIELTDLKLLSIALAKSDPENSESENSIVKIKSVSIWTIILYVLIVLIVMCILAYKFHLKLYNCFAQSSPVVSKNENFELKEGGVMYAETSMNARVSAIF
ncbi:uncharacterized protein LOC123723246, partial [Papilio machaon]|uniref:uncharacterized protein LOC123723246 n=1 Tax=Papilio machaon TaxID=76193 RepID=UPI001E662E10